MTNSNLPVRNLIGAIDQGTSSSRFIIFEANNAKPLVHHQIEVERLCPKEGWVEQDPRDLLNSTLLCIEKTVEKMKVLGLNPQDVRAVGLANQRETVVAWNKITGEPLYNAIVWLDTRTTGIVEDILSSPSSDDDVKRMKEISGLRLNNYFSALKIKWLLDNVESVQKAVAKDECLVGTVDAWLIWNLTGGKTGGIHMTDVTNACRTLLMDIHSLNWDPFLCSYFKIPETLLPKIRTSSEIYGYLSGTQLDGVPIASCMGDQQAALVGHKCFQPGQAKCTFGTGCFLLFNTGEQMINTSHGLLTTVAYKLGPKSPTIYALEGSAGIAGAAMRWLRDNLGIASSYEELEALAATVTDSQGVYFVPAFSGLFAPHWRSDARGTICGLTEHSTKAHIAKASFEATAFQVKDLLEAMNQECGFPLTFLQVDGGMTANTRFMQLQADFLGINTRRPAMAEATGLGAAMAAGSAEGIGVWNIHAESSTSVIPYETFEPKMEVKERAARYSKWKQAVARSFDWERREGS